MDTKHVILITGSSTGFGRLIAESAARRGHTVFATMRDPEGRNAKNAAEIRTLATRESLPLHVLGLDVTDDASVEKAVRAAAEQAGRIDVAINNAGYVIVGLAEATTTQQVQQIFETNFFGSVRVNRAVLPYMRRQRSGLLLHVSSGAGRLVLPGFGVYCSSKFALEALAETYHYELASQGIESCILEPGAYETPIFGKNVTAADESRTDTYGAVSQLPAKMSAALAAVAGDAREVSDAVLQIVETPAGQRQLRYRVSPSASGVDQINALTEATQAQVLKTFGVGEETKFVLRSAAGA